MSGGRELQIGAPGGTADTAVHVERIALLASALEGRVESAPPIARLPRCIPSTDLPATDGDRVVIGLGHKTLKPVSISLDGIFVVTGPPGSGRSTAMRTIVRNARSARPAAAFHLLSVRQGELVDEPHWGESAVSPGSARAVSERLVGLFEGDEPVSGTDIVIVIEGATDFEGDADSATARLIGVARRSGAVVIAETDTVTGSGAWAVHGQLKAARSGIALQPDEADGIGLFRVQFPRVRRSEFPVGRGILVNDGHISSVQVGLSER
jgi:S-DNA-T family DNA segregation ATPase FtsK/SpoIIIE